MSINTADSATPRPAPGPAPSPCAAYRGDVALYDEMRDGDAAGPTRPHWRTFATRFDALGAPEIEHRWEQAQRLIQENGVTYNVYGDPRGMDRPWALDPVPLLISPEEWRGIEAALIQRAKLLDLVLADLYGPQKLLTEGHLPPELAFANRGFLRPVHGAKVPGGSYLTLYGVDLARSPDGRWWVLGDRTQAPSGAGYALENRTVISRILPLMFRDCRVQRLASFFAALRDTLVALAPTNSTSRDNPRIVLLTPGPYNETYFEHAYLARYLGFTLVEGGDLTVRDNRVYLKTLSGLRRVDVILRRLDDDFCDPLELRADSTLGVTGLVQAAAAGEVTIANALGSGLVEAPAFMPFVPGLCRHLLGEDEKLPSLATWWCGQEAEREYVFEHLDELVIKPAFRNTGPVFAGGGNEPVFGAELDAASKAQLIAMIRARPHLYVAQESVELSTAPTWHDGQLVPRHVVVRAFVAATATGGYVVMPGGLTRVSASADSRVVSMQRGGGSKDTWVLAAPESAVNTFSLLRPAEQPVELTRGGFELPSRVADNLYWLGRYVERAEGLVRLLRALLGRMTEEYGGGPRPELPALLRALASVTRAPKRAAPKGEKAEEPSDAAQLLAAIHDAGQAYSLRSTLGNVRRLASIVRDRLSIDTWRILRRLEHDLDGEAPSRLDADSLPDLMLALDQMIITLAAFSGLGMESMTRGHGWRFLDMGRRIERATYLVDLMRTLLTTVDPQERMILDALLEVADSSMTYRSRYLTTVQPMPVLDLLLMDESNPRSVAFQLATVHDHVAQLPHDPAAVGLTDEERIATAMITSLRLADAHRLAGEDDANLRDALSYLLSDLSAQLRGLSDVVTQRYLAHAEATRALAGGS